MVREPVVKGQFYQADPERLREQIKACYAHRHGVNRSLPEKDGQLLAIISPHAGYSYSGPVASHAFARLACESERPEVILLLGPKHTAYGAPFSISSHSSWQTPLGKVGVDSVLANKLAAEVKLLQLDEAAHRFEHSLEVQLPFIQNLYPDPPTIVPVALHFSDFLTIQNIADGIASVVEKEARKVLIVVSSDFSHDTPKEEAYRLDAEVIDLILRGDARGFYDLVAGEDRSVCGLMPITALLVILSKLKCKAKLLKYATSMDMCPHERGVGYASLSFEALA